VTVSLFDAFPLIAAQADGWDPVRVTPGSGKRLTWKCSLGHKWDAVVQSRVKHNSGCPYCDGRRLLVGFNDFATLHPQLAIEALEWNPSNYLSNSTEVKAWKCSSDHVWETKINLRTKRGFGCPYCNGNKLMSGFNDLASKYPEIASEAVEIDPSLVHSGSEKKINWRCQNGHEWRASIANRTRLRSGCPVCSNQTTLPGFNDIATTHPEIAVEACGWDPSQFVIGSNKLLKWKCKSGHIFESRPNKRKRGDGCPICSNHQVVIGENDLATTHPDLAIEAYGWDPKSISSGSNKRREWRCKEGHQWKAIVASRTRLNTGCPTCSNKRVLKGFNDLATTHPKIAAEAHGWDPSLVSFGIKGKREWKCELGHTWIALVTNRTFRNDNCPVCSGKKVLVGFNDLATVHPDIAAEADGWDPTSVTAGASSRRFNWKCSEGHRWTSKSANRQMAGCPTCANFGYKPGLPGWLYLLQHEIWGLSQLGITNNPDSRLKQHARSGWELVDLRGPMDGLLASELETEILRSIRKQGISLGKFGKFDGYTESWQTKELPASKLIDLISRLDP